MIYRTPAVVASGEIATQTQGITPPPHALEGGIAPSIFKTII